MTHGQKKQSAIRDIHRGNNNSNANLAPEMLDDRDLISSNVLHELLYELGIMVSQSEFPNFC